MNQVRREQPAVAWVESQGGGVREDNWFGSIWQVTFHDVPLNDLSRLPELPNLQQVFLQETEVRDLSPLADLPALLTVTIIESPVSDLTPLSGLEDLAVLNLFQTEVQDLSPLAGLENLWLLDVRMTKVRDSVAATDAQRTEIAAAGRDPGQRSFSPPETGAIATLGCHRHGRERSRCATFSSGATDLQGWCTRLKRRSRPLAASRGIFVGGEFGVW